MNSASHLRILWTNCSKSSVFLHRIDNAGKVGRLLLDRSLRRRMAQSDTHRRHSLIHKIKVFILCWPGNIAILVNFLGEQYSVSRIYVSFSGASATSVSVDETGDGCLRSGHFHWSFIIFPDSICWYIDSSSSADGSRSSSLGKQGMLQSSFGLATIADAVY